VLAPPVELGHISGAALSKKVSHTKRGEPFYPGKAIGQTPYCRIIEMIVVIVGDKREVDRRKILKNNAGGNEPMRTRKRNRRGTVRPDRVGKDIHTATLNKE
jgi:hypothetical protein